MSQLGSYLILWSYSLGSLILGGCVCFANRCHFVALGHTFHQMLLLVAVGSGNWEISSSKENYIKKNALHSEMYHIWHSRI